MISLRGLQSVLQQQSPIMYSKFGHLSVTSAVRCSITFLLVLSGLLVGLHCANEEGRGIINALQLTSGALDGRAGEVMPMVMPFPYI